MTAREKIQQQFAFYMKEKKEAREVNEKYYDWLDGITAGLSLVLSLLEDEREGREIK